MLFYFAPANYHYLFTTHPKVGWVPKRVLVRAVRALVNLAVPAQPPQGYPHPAHNPGPHFSTFQRCCRVSSPAPEQLFGFLGLSLGLDCYLGFG